MTRCVVVVVAIASSRDRTQSRDQCSPTDLSNCRPTVLRPLVLAGASVCVQPDVFLHSHIRNSSGASSVQHFPARSSRVTVRCGDWSLPAASLSSQPNGQERRDKIRVIATGQCCLCDCDSLRIFPLISTVRKYSWKSVVQLKIGFNILWSGTEQAIKSGFAILYRA